MRRRNTPPAPNLMVRALSHIWPPLANTLYRAQLQFAAASGYAAAQHSRLNRERNTADAGSEDRHLDDKTLWELREISRDMDRNNGLTAGLFDRAVENIWGANGYDLQPQTGSKDLDRYLQQDWISWLTRCDVRGEFSGTELFGTALREQLVAGDCLTEWDDEHNDGEGGVFFYEADRCLNPGGIKPPPGEPIVNGIRFDRRGRKLAYFIADMIPNSQWHSVKEERGRWRPADSIMHFYDPRRFSQSRGRPIVAPVIRDIDDLDDLLLYERVGAKLVAAHGFFVESDDPVDTANALQSVTDSASEGQRIEEVTPGAIHYLKTGQKVSSVTSNRPSNNFESFVKLLLRFVGLPLGFPYELVVLDFSHVNFASSRQLLNQAQRSFVCRQYKHGGRVSKVYAKWLKRRIGNGYYKGFTRQIESGAIYRQRWGYPGWPSPNPLQDAQAGEIGLRNQFLSRTTHNRRFGINQTDIFDELSQEQQQAQANGQTDPAAPDDQQQAAALTELQRLRDLAVSMYEEESDAGDSDRAEQAAVIVAGFDSLIERWSESGSEAVE